MGQTNNTGEVRDTLEDENGICISKYINKAKQNA